MVKDGSHQITADRRIAFVRGASINCVDTMLPEAAKRVYRWDSASVLPTAAGPLGIGTGTMYLPGSPALAGADPDLLASMTFPIIPGSIKPMPVSIQSSHPLPVLGRPQNRYAAPYGN